MRMGSAGAGATFALLLVSCSPTAQHQDADIAVRAITTTTTTDSVSSTAPDPNALAIGSAFKTREGNTVTILSFEQPVLGDAVGADEGKEFAAIEAEFCAGKRGAPRVTPARFVLEMADGDRRVRSYFGPKQPEFPDTKVMANQCVQGWVSFEVPEGQRPSYAVFDGSSVGRWSTARR